MNNEPIEDGEVGNNDTTSLSSKNQLYKFDFVLNNYTELERANIITKLREISKKFIVAKEIGEQGTPHLQCYCSLKKKMRFDTLNKALGNRCSIRKCRNEDALIEYCKKEGNYETFGFPKPIKIIENLYPWQQGILDIYLTEPDERTIYWYWDSSGNIGKSAFVKYMVIKHNVLFCNGGKHSDLINLVFNANMDDCKCIIWDLPRSTKGKVSYATLECVKNGMVCNTKYETGVKCFNAPHVFVFANYPPDDTSELSEDRWKIIEL